MAKLERPLDPDAVRAADEAIYAAHAGDPRPNALYDASGNRLLLSGTDPAQAALRKEWVDYYKAALEKKKNPGGENPASPPAPPDPKPPGGDTPPDEPVEPCPKKLHWIQLTLLRLKDQKKRPDWWAPAPSSLPYAYEPFKAKITDGPKEDALDGSGVSRYDSIPGGNCEWHFHKFFEQVENDLKPAKAQDDGKSIVAPPRVAPKDYKVTLTVEKPLLTLKHNRDCKLEIKVEPAEVVASAFRIEIRRDSGRDWKKISDTSKMEPWHATIAGKFKVRGVVTVAGKEFFSVAQDVEVQFPDYNDIVGDPDVVAAVNAEWQTTLADCTQVPNQRRERGFWIQLDTTANKYTFGATVLGAFVGPAAGAAVPLPTRPGDNPANPAVDAKGAVYQVASFHTHTPTEFRVGLPAGTTRGIGPSGADNRIDTNDDVPGVVYDFTESPAGTGNIPMLHPKNSAAQLYHSRGKNRRTTPP